MLFNACIKRFACLALTIAISLPAITSAAPHSLDLPAFSAQYKVRYGILSGKMNLKLTHAGDRYRYETALRPKGVVSWLRSGEIRETTTVVIADRGLLPLDYSNVDTIARPDRRANYEFDMTAGRVTGEYKQQAVDKPLRLGGQNRASAHVAIMHALQSGNEISGFPVFDKARWRDFELEVIPDQFAKTPFGDFKTVEIRYASKGKDKSWSLHCAPDLNFVPVVIEFREGGKTKSRARLTDYRVGE